MILAPLPTANLFSLGDHLTMVAARLIRNMTREGFQEPSLKLHTYALRSYRHREVWHKRISTKTQDLHCKLLFRYKSNIYPERLHDMFTYSSTCHKFVVSGGPVHASYT